MALNYGSGPGALNFALYLIASFALMVVTIVFVVRMARAYGIHIAWAIIGGIALIPCAGLLLLLGINQRVTSTLQKAGVKVGLMGVGTAEMIKLRQGYCLGCGYEMRGLASRTCPECGRQAEVVA